jgi:hypothetical protein
VDEYYWTAIFIHQYLNDVLDSSTYIYIRLITLFATYLSILVLPSTNIYGQNVKVVLYNTDPVLLNTDGLALGW